MIRKLLAMLAFAIVSSCASAGIVKVTFDTVSGASGSPYFGNFTSSGFTFSPSCHVDFDSLYGSRAIGWDSSGCDGGVRGKDNRDYLGTRPVSYLSSYVYVDSDGHPFSFLSYDHHGHPVSIFSSKGGFYNQEHCSFSDQDCSGFNTYLMDGPDWIGVKWIIFGYNDPGAPAALIDNLVFRVSSPGTGVLAFCGGLLLWTTRRRRYQHKV